MIDIDSRINKALEGSDALIGDSYRNNIKQLIRDVLREIKPNRVINRPPGINIGGNFINQGSLSVDPRAVVVRNAVIDEMEAKINKMGL